MSDFSRINHSMLGVAMYRSLVLLSITELLAIQSLAADWPAFRGPNGAGIAEGASYPTEWSQEENIKWHVTLPPDNGSPIVVKDQVVLLSGEEEGKRRSTVAFDRKTGHEIWRRTVEYPKLEATHETNPHCPSTPVSDGRWIVAWHRSAGMHCYDLDGNPLWSRDLGEFHHIWGGGSSPIIYHDMVIQLCGPGERTFVVALDKRTGETVWQTADEPGGSDSSQGKYIGTWSTPSIVQVDGQDQLLVPFHSRVVAYELHSGNELWMVEGLSGERSDLVYASAAVGEGIGVVLGGYSGPAFAFKLGGSGDMTGRNRLWYHPQNNPQRIGSGVIADGQLYMANADGPGSIQCLDIASGEENWSERRTPDGPHWGSVVLAGGNLYVTGQKGITRVFKPNSEQYEVVAENDLGEQSNSTPAFSDGEIFLRTSQGLYCIAEKE